MEELPSGADSAPLESLPQVAWFDWLLSAWLITLLAVFIGLRVVGSATFLRLVNPGG